VRREATSLWARPEDGRDAISRQPISRARGTAPRIAGSPDNTIRRKKRRLLGRARKFEGWLSFRFHGHAGVMLSASDLRTMFEFELSLWRVGLLTSADIDAVAGHPVRQSAATDPARGRGSQLVERQRRVRYSRAFRPTRIATRLVPASEGGLVGAAFEPPVINCRRAFFGQRQLWNHRAFCPEPARCGKPARQPRQPQPSCMFGIRWWSFRSLSFDLSLRAGRRRPCSIGI